MSQSYPLELAVFNGKYYVSFPPFPSIVLLPFVMIFGVKTPDSAIAIMLALISVIYAYKISQIFLKNELQSIFFSLFLCAASNYLHVASWGAVWYLAQNMSFVLTLMSIYYALTDRNEDSAISLFLLACAVGCRPFQVIYSSLILTLIYERYIDKGKKISLNKIILWFVPAIGMGFVYMLLNYFRFGNAFDFGHSYLPEFVESQYGQFNTTYLLENLKKIFILMPTINSNGILDFPMFDGGAFWIVSPIVISYLVYFVFSLLSKKSMLGIRAVKKTTLCLALTLILLHLLTLALHKTMGGYHFGNRYTVDCLPVLFFGLVNQKKYLSDKYTVFNLPLCLLGVGVNLIGSINCFRGF